MTYNSAGQGNVEVVIDSLTGQPEWLDPDDLAIKLLDASGAPTGRLLYDNTDDAFSISGDPADQIAAADIEGSAYYGEIGDARHPLSWPGSKAREAFDHFFTRGAGAGKMNVAENIVDLSADVDGKFVGSSVDGPLAALGTWALTGTNKFIFLGNDYKSHIVGSFGVELVPAP